MRPWIVHQASLGNFGLKWLDKDETLLGIPWIHKARADYKTANSELFQVWSDISKSKNKGTSTSAKQLFKNGIERSSHITYMAKLSSKQQKIYTVHKATADKFKTTHEIQREAEGLENNTSQAVASLQHRKDLENTAIEVLLNLHLYLPKL